MFIQQISVFIENRHGSLTDFTQLLGENGVDLIALSIADTTNFGILRAIVSDNEKTLKVVRDKGYTANLTEVLAVAVPDVPGGLAGGAPTPARQRHLRGVPVFLRAPRGQRRHHHLPRRPARARGEPSARQGRAPARAGRDRLIPRSFIHRLCISLHNRRRFPAQNAGNRRFFPTCARNCMKLSKKILANRFRGHYNNTVRSRAGVAIRSHRKGKVT